MAKLRPIPKTIVYRFGVAFKRTTPSHLTGDSGDFECPKCQAVGSFKFIDEHMQRGYFFHKYFEFLECGDCGYHACLVMNRKEDDYVNV